MLSHASGSCDRSAMRRRFVSVPRVARGTRRFNTAFANELDDPHTHNIKRIVLTGGPCGGKSSGLSYIANFLRNAGFSVYAVPEAATLMMSNGVSFGGVTRDQLIDTQAELCRVQLNLENSMFNIARSRANKAVILSDRGALDGKAYLPPDCWEELLHRNGWTETDLREARYDGVVHLVSTAIGAEAYYSSANNSVRSETVEKAQQIDLTLQHAWLGHPHVTIIDNSTPFVGKLQRVTEFVCQLVGLPVPSSRVKRFLVTSPLREKLPVPFTDFYLEKIYLAKTVPNLQMRLEARTSTKAGSTTVYRYTEKRYEPQGCPPWDSDRKHLWLNMRRITKNEFVALLPLAAPDRQAVKQHVRNFVWKTVDPPGVLEYVEVTTTKENDQLQFPPWIDIGKDVTDSAQYTSFYRSKTKD